MEILITFFKPSGKYYMEEKFEIPDNTFDWNISEELKKDKRFIELVNPNNGIGFTATGILTEFEVPFMISPYNL